jgi:hypothetical protein
MTFRPSHTIYLPARYAEDAGGHNLSTRRRPLASAPSDGGPTTAMPTPPDSTSPLQLDSDGQVDKTPAPGFPARSAGMRAAPSHDTGFTRESSPSTSTEIIDNDALAAKKGKSLKTLRPSDTMDSLGMHTDVQVMDIDDVCDPREEALNKTDATADLRFFFLLLPLLRLDKPRYE